MKVKIVRIDKALPLPEYQTEGSVAFDIYSRVDLEIPAHETRIAPSNLIVEVPAGHFLMIAARSSLYKKKIMVSNGIGVVDQDFHGPKDEIGVLLYNSSHELVSVKRGDRVAQGLIVPIQKADWEEVSEIKKDSRGGFGSTG